MSGKCLDVAGAGTADGTNVQLADCNGGPAQNRKIVEDKDLGDVATVTSKVSGKCLDVAGAGTADGTNVWQWTCSAGNSAQMWEFILDE